MTTFADRLRAARLAVSLTQGEAAGLFLALSPRTWEGWEAGRSTPPEWAQHLILDRLEKLAITGRK